MTLHPEGMLGTWLIGSEEEQEVLEVLRSRSLFRHYGPDPQHKADLFERRLEERLSVRHALAVSSGTAALRCALAGLDVRPGDEVLVPPCTFVATANAVVLAGAVPVFAEIDDSLGLDPARLEERLTPRTVGIVPVHLQGMACAIEEIVDFARGRGLWVVEDCAQALGARYRGRHLGTFGELGAFSLQAHKTITCGEGGVVVSDREDLFRRARRFQDQGGDRQGDAYPSWEHAESGFGENLKLSELQAAVAVAQLGKLDRLEKRHRALYGELEQRVDLGGRRLRRNLDPGGALPYGFLFFAHDGEDRCRLLDRLAAAEIPADTLYDQPLYESAPFVRWAAGDHVPGLPDFGLRPRWRRCPRSEALLARIVRIPLNPTLTEDEIGPLAARLDQALAVAS